MFVALSVSDDCDVSVETFVLFLDTTTSIRRTRKFTSSVSVWLLKELKFDFLINLSSINVYVYLTLTSIRFTGRFYRIASVFVFVAKCQRQHLEGRHRERGHCCSLRRLHQQIQHKRQTRHLVCTSFFSLPPVFTSRLQRHVCDDVAHFCRSDSESWKSFLVKPSLPIVLRLLEGLSRGHAPTQLLVGESLIPVLHKLEQVSSEGNIGTLAENLMEALLQNTTVALKVRVHLPLWRQNI